MTLCSKQVFTGESERRERGRGREGEEGGRGEGEEGEGRSEWEGGHQKRKYTQQMSVVNKQGTGPGNWPYHNDPSSFQVNTIYTVEPLSKNTPEMRTPL